MIVYGMEVYVGFMLMELCCDVLLVVVDFVCVVNGIVCVYLLYGCGMVGWVDVYLNLCNVIFGCVMLIVDLCVVDDVMLMVMDV